VRVVLQYSATHCNTLQHTATHCNTLRVVLQYSRRYICAALCLRFCCVAGRCIALQLCCSCVAVVLQLCCSCVALCCGDKRSKMCSRVPDATYVLNLAQPKIAAYCLLLVAVIATHCLLFVAVIATHCLLFVAVIAAHCRLPVAVSLATSAPPQRVVLHSLWGGYD